MLRYEVWLWMDRRRRWVEEEVGGPGGDKLSQLRDPGLNIAG